MLTQPLPPPPHPFSHLHPLTPRPSPSLSAHPEHKKQPLTRLFGNSRYRAAYIFALTVFSFGLLRDGLFKTALAHQPTLDVLATAEVKAAAVVAFVVGSVLVVSSMRALGIIGTYMGDYFGIL